MYDIARSQYLRLIDLFVQKFGLDCQIFSADVQLDQYDDPDLSNVTYTESKVMMGAPLVTMLGYPVAHLEDSLPIAAVFPSSVDVDIDWTVRIKEVAMDKIHWRWYSVINRRTDAYIGIPIIWGLAPLRRAPSSDESGHEPSDEGTVIGY